MTGETNLDQLLKTISATYLSLKAVNKMPREFWNKSLTVHWIKLRQA